MTANPQPTMMPQAQQADGAVSLTPVDGDIMPANAPGSAPMPGTAPTAPAQVGQPQNAPVAAQVADPNAGVAASAPPEPAPNQQLGQPPNQPPNQPPAAPGASAQMPDQPPGQAPAAPATIAQAPGASEAANLDAVMRIPVSVKAVLGSASMPVANLMKLGRGAVIGLDQKVGQPIDLVVNGRVVARGEVVLMPEDQDRFGISLTEIVSGADGGVV